MFGAQVCGIKNDEFEIHFLSLCILPDIIIAFKLLIDGKETILKHNGTDLYIDPDQNPHGIDIHSINRRLKDDEVRKFTDYVRQTYISKPIWRLGAEEKLQTPGSYGTFIYKEFRLPSSISFYS